MRETEAKEEPERQTKIRKERERRSQERKRKRKEKFFDEASLARRFKRPEAMGDDLYDEARYKIV